MEEKNYEYSPNFTAEELDAILEDIERNGGCTGPRFTDVDDLITSLYEKFGDKETPLEKFNNFFSNIYQKLLRVMRLSK